MRSLRKRIHLPKEEQEVLSDRCRLKNHRPNWRLVHEYNELAALYDEMRETANAELTRLYDKVELLLAERALANAAEEAAKAANERGS